MSLLNWGFFRPYLAPSKLSLAFVSPRMTSSNWRFWFIKKAVIFFTGGMLDVLPWREEAYTPYISGRCPRLETTSWRRRVLLPASSMQPQSQPTCAFVRYPTCQEGWILRAWSAWQKQPPREKRFDELGPGSHLRLCHLCHLGIACLHDTRDKIAQLNLAIIYNRQFSL